MAKQPFYGLWTYEEHVQKKCKLHEVGELKPPPPPPTIPSDINFGMIMTQDNVSDVFLEAFRALGGLEGLVRWGRTNPDEFYKLLGRFAKPNPGGSAPSIIINLSEDLRRVIDITPGA